MKLKHKFLKVKSSLELASRRKLQDHLIETATSTLSSLPAEDEDVSALVTSLCQGDDILTLMGMDEEDENSTLELLGHIIHLYISIHGFAISKTWMEEYKVAVTTTTKKKEALPKQLKL